MKYALKDSIAYRLIKNSNSVIHSLNKKLVPFKIAIEQRATLEIIKFEENINQTKIATLLGKDKATISRSLDSLEKKELITRVSDVKKDKRSKTIKLTNKGEEILAKSLPEVATFRESLKSKITDEEHNELFRILNKLDL